MGVGEGCGREKGSNSEKGYVVGGERVTEVFQGASGPIKLTGISRKG